MAAHYHATRITRRQGRRIMDGPGARENVCGAALTDKDMPVRDFMRAGGFVSSSGETACPACAFKLVTSAAAKTHERINA
jgi:hypothetical protein